METHASKQKLLFVEDSPTDAALLLEALKGTAANPFSTHHVWCLDDALAALKGQSYDAILLDLGLPDTRGTDGVERICSHSPAVPVVVLTSNDEDQTALDAISKGAQDYLIKRLPFPSATRLLKTLSYAIARRAHHARQTLGHSTESSPPSTEILHQKTRSATELVGSRRTDAELDLVRARLRRLATTAPDELSEEQERVLLSSEVALFTKLLGDHFVTEERKCFGNLETMPDSLHEALDRVLEQHRTILQRLDDLVKYIPLASLADAKRMILETLYRFIEHEIAEGPLLNAIEEE